MARAMREFEHYEADQFFEQSGEYSYDARSIAVAHEWCQTQTFKALANGKRVVVSNTFTLRAELEPYFHMCKRFWICPVVIEAKGTWSNVHGVPAAVIEQMRKRWETIPDNWITGAITVVDFY